MKGKAGKAGKKTGKANHKGLAGKRWDPSLEESIRARWRKEQPFRFDLRRKGNIF
jgi:hypothetical protein